MRKTRYTQEQIAFTLKQQIKEVTADLVCHGCQRTYFFYGGKIG